jgi:hypothetical protein
MYSFAQRGDTRVIDEPLYGHYLRVSAAPHPGREQVLAAMNCDGNSVMQSLLHPATLPARPVLFMKHMAHHLVEIDTSFLNETHNVFLIRDPEEMLPSLTIQLPQAALADTGLAVQSRMHDELRSKGQQPAILDSRELLLDPSGVLAAMCRQLGIRFDSRMLSWPKGPIPEDGVWAKHWYHAVHQSTGFSRYEPKRSFPEHLRGLLDECAPHYEKLFRHAIRATTGD